MTALFCFGVFMLAVAVCLFLIWLVSDWPAEIDRKLEDFKKEMTDACAESEGWRIDCDTGSRDHNYRPENRIAGRWPGGDRSQRSARYRRPPMGDSRAN